MTIIHLFCFVFRMETKPWSEEEKKLLNIYFHECASLPADVLKQGFGLIVNRFAAKGFHRTKEEIKAYCRCHARPPPARGK